MRELQKSRTRTLINALIRELEQFKERKNINSLANIVSIKRTLRSLEDEKIIDMNESYELEVHLLGILNLLKQKNQG